jgi:hypothetical protein
MKNIEKLIENVKSSKLPEFPFSDAQVRTVLEDVDSSVFLKNKIKIGVITMTVISTLIMSIILSMVYLISIPSSEIKSELKKQVLSQNTISPESEFNYGGKKQDLSQNKNKTNYKYYSTHTVDNQQNAKIGSNTISEQQVIDITETGTTESNKDTIDILVLNENELENIFIRKTVCGYLGMVEETYPINQSQEQMDEIKALHYPRKGHKHSIYLYGDNDISYVKATEYTGWEVEKSEGVYPVSSMLLKFDSTKSHLKRSIRRGGIGPIEFDSKIVNSKFFNNISKIFLNFKNKEVKNSIKVVYDKKECPDQKSLVQIYLKCKSNEGEAHIILTYPASKNFIDLLPKRYNIKPYESIFEGLGAELNAKELKNEMSKAFLNQKDFCDKAKYNNDEMEAKFRSMIPASNPIAGIERLILSKEELADIGININNDTIFTTTEDWIDLSLMPQKVQTYIKNDLGYNFKGYALLKANVKFDKGINSKGELIPEPIKYTGWDIKSWSPFSPACISINRKINDYTLFTSQTFQSPWLVDDSSTAYIRSEDLLSQDSTGKFVSKLSKLIPVHLSDIKIDDKSDTLSNEIDFWFVANNEFVMKLPERYRDPIMKELDLIKSVENGSLPIENACEILKGATSYFGICSSGNNDVNQIRVFPNPVTKGTATLFFSLKNEQKLKIELFSSDGKFTELIKNFESYTSGSNTVKIDLSKMGSGVYLLSLTDDSKIRATVKLIK